MLTLLVAVTYLFVRTYLRRWEAWDCTVQQTTEMSLSPGDELVQEFVNKADVLSEIQIRQANTNTHHQIHVMVQARDTGQVWFEGDLAEDACRDEYLRIIFPKVIKGQRGAYGRLIITLPESENSSLSLFLGKEYLGTKYECYFNGKEDSQDIWVAAGGSRTTGGIYVIIKIVFFLLWALSVGSYAMIYIWKWKLHRIYFYAVLLTGFIYALLIPGCMKSDELRHFSRSIQILEYFQRDIGEEAEIIAIRKGDKELKLREIIAHSEFTRDYIDAYHDMLLQPCSNNSQVWVSSTYFYKNYDPVSSYKLQIPAYLPSIIGILIGKCMGLSLPGVIVCARFWNILIFAIIGAYCIGIIPVGRNVLFVMSMLPETIHQISCISYDMWLIGLTILICSISVEILFHQEYANWSLWKADKKNFNRFILLAMASILILPVKNFGAAPVAFVPMLVLLLKYHHIKWVRRTFWGLAVVALMAGTAIIFCKREMLGQLLWEPHMCRTFPKEQAYSLQKLIREPASMLLLGYNFFLHIGEWFVQLFGARLSSMNLHVDIASYAPYIVLLYEAAQGRQEDIQRVKYMHCNKRGYIVGMLSIGVLVGSLPVVAMFLYSTRANHIYVEGVQGRYFISMAIIMLLGLCICNKGRSRIQEKKIYLYSILCHIMMIASIYKNIFHTVEDFWQ